MNASPRKPFLLAKSASNLQTPLEPNSNERFINQRISYPLISSFQEHIEDDSTFSALLYQSINSHTSLFHSGLMHFQAQSRLIPSRPYKILDAPNLQDNFGYSVLDWGSLNIIAVALSTQVYLYDTQASKALLLFENAHNISSLHLSRSSQSIAIGLESGQVLIYDINTQKLLMNLESRNSRVGIMRWKNTTITSGDSSGYLVHNDIRQPTYFLRIKAHYDEICSIEWEGDSLATGSNDKTAKVWDNFNDIPSVVLKGHTSAVKCVCWSPCEKNMLITGGDTTIRVWNPHTGTSVMKMCTGSQVCSILASNESKELVSGNGFNEIDLWKYPKMTRTGILRGHQEKVFYLAASPNNQDIVSGAGDSTLRFWNIFQYSKNSQHEKQSFIKSIR